MKKSTVSSRAEVSQTVSFSDKLPRTAVEGTGPLSVKCDKRQTTRKKKNNLPIPAEEILSVHSISGQPLLEAKSNDAINVPPKESPISRLRLGKVFASKETPRLASTRDDSAIKDNKEVSLVSAQDNGTKEKSNPSDFVNSIALRYPVKNSAILRVARKLERRQKESQPPRIDSFADFLAHHAQVKSGSGYIPYHFSGREALRPIVERLDQVLASGEPDVSLALCGGAQFGKTALMLNLLTYLVAVRFRNVGYYLPDDDLVSGLVDGKLRPDVLDRIPWLARLIAVGKTLSPSGRAVNRKGAFLCTDGKRTALAFMRGLGKIPTSFSMDVVIQDEKDDLPEEHARFLAGRMTASNLRLTLLIGTQRYHGAGQNLAFTEGTQHIGLLVCPQCGRRHNPETLWPGICRLERPESPAHDWPWLTVEGHFAFSDGRQLPIPFTPGQRYVLACVECGAVLNREHPQWHAQAPEREAQRRWSYRISQLLIPDIDLSQIVAAWQQAIREPEHMTVFCTDRLALPKSTTQSLTPHDLQAARGDYRILTELRNSTELGTKAGKATELILRQTPSASLRARLAASAGEDDRTENYSANSVKNSIRFGGLDMGDQCWFVAREVDAKRPYQARLLWIETIAAERVRVRVPELFRQLNLSVLCVDAGPLRDLSRDLAFLLNDLGEDAVPSGNDPARNITFTRGDRRPAVDGYPALRWHAASEKWQNVRCVPVEFTQREGQGLRHKLARTQDGRLYPLLAAHRDETIQRVIQELLPPSEAHPRLLDRADGSTVLIPTQRFLLPQATEESRAVLDLYERHLLAGARQERSSDGRTLRYLDKCENHFLLATAYAALAELLAPTQAETSVVVPAFRALPSARSHARRERSVVG
jgi:hypothetical protein